jgi:branched-chain amino acid transport system ATP-binding protein
MLSVRGLTKQFDGLTAIRNLDLEVSRGCITGILGPNGAGKTTFFNMLSGIFRCSEGEIIFDGQALRSKSCEEIAELGIGRTFQVVRPFTELTALENVLSAMGAMHHKGILGTYRQYLRPEHLNRARELLKLTELEQHGDTVARHLPLGLLRRLEIARALGLSPKMLLLDESFSGLSHAEAESLSSLVRRLCDGGMTILLIEHNMYIAMRLCDRIAVLDRGEKIAEGRPDEIRSDSRVINAYLGAEAES